MPDPNLGASVAAAHRFLTEIHNQLAQLLTALDAQMREHGWVETHPNLTSGVGYALNSGSWMLDYLYRFYFPKDANGRSSRVVGVLLYLEPPASWSEPPMLCFGAKFDSPKSHADIADPRSWTTSVHISTALAGKTEVQPVPYDVYKMFLPKASAFRGVALPVFALTGPDDLRERVTNVLLRADEELGK